MKEKGIKGIITDLDNTLVEWDRPVATPEVIEWFEKMKKHNIKVTIVSNNNEQSGKSFFRSTENSIYISEQESHCDMLYTAAKQMDLKKEEMVVIGDQLLTDVFGGNRSGFNTILVVPVAQTDGFATKLNRFVERRMLNWFRKKGMLQWEE